MKNQSNATRPRKTRAVRETDHAARLRAEEALRERERQLREAQHLARIGSWEWDLEKQMLTWSDEVYHIFGLEPDTFQPSAEALEAAIHPSDREEFLRQREQMLAEKKSVCIDHRIVLPVGEVRHVQERAQLIIDAQGNVQRVVGTVQDMTERKQAEQEREALLVQVREANARLQSLSARLVEIQEMERGNLARELHDRVGQDLTTLSINLNLARGQLAAQDAVQARLENCQRLVSQLGEHVRDVMAELRPPVLDDYGLVAALQWYARQFSEDTELLVEVHGEELAPRLVLSVELSLFRIVQEALNNVVKHAGASRVQVTLASSSQTACLTIADDGAGFVMMPEKSWGLSIMRERARAVGGDLRVESALGKGTKIMIEVAR